MKTPKRIIVISILLIMGSLLGIGGSALMIFSEQMRAMMPPGPVPAELSMAINIVGGIFTILCAVGILNKMTKARIAYFTYAIIMAIYNTFTAFMTDNTQTSALVSKELQVALGVVFQLIILGITWWALFSEKSNKYFGIGSVQEENNKVAAAEDSTGATE